MPGVTGAGSTAWKVEHGAAVAVQRLDLLAVHDHRLSKKLVVWVNAAPAASRLRRWTFGGRSPLMTTGRVVDARVFSVSLKPRSATAHFVAAWSPRKKSAR